MIALLVYPLKTLLYTDQRYLFLTRFDDSKLDNFQTIRFTSYILTRCAGQAPLLNQTVQFFQTLISLAIL